MLFSIEALDAEEGDCLLLHFGSADDHRIALIDGGPGGTYERQLGPRLRELHAQAGLSASVPLPLELVVVTHTDSDHIVGIIELTRAMLAAKDARAVAPISVGWFWHNSFDDHDFAAGDEDEAEADPDERVEATDHELVVQGASIGEGAELRDALGSLGLDGNPPYDGPVMLGGLLEDSLILADGHEATVTVLGPSERELSVASAIRPSRHDRGDDKHQDQRDARTDSAAESALPIDAATGITNAHRGRIVAMNHE